MLLMIMKMNHNRWVKQIHPHSYSPDLKLSVKKKKKKDIDLNDTQMDNQVSFCDSQKKYSLPVWT